MSINLQQTHHNNQNAKITQNFVKFGVATFLLILNSFKKEIDLATI